VSRRLPRAFRGALVAQAVLLAAARSGVLAPRDNYRGRPVTLAGGLALAAGLGVTQPPRAAAAVLAIAAAGSYDDAVGADDDAKGVRGHIEALAAGRVTSGAVKLLAIPALALVAVGRSGADRPLDAAVVAGSANLVNLLDLRPGRALKAAVTAGLLLDQPGVVGSCAAVLPSELGERTMLGDAGANALGAALGIALVTRVASRPGRLAALAVLVALTATSERVSFSAVIDASPLLRRLDRLGRSV
jgi:UDP-N-acetylmuramyl pentapeptide phosphotransferase/UDP-N-acetylglucosamine-1-phosphate transferase